MREPGLMYGHHSGVSIDESEDGTVQVNVHDDVSETDDVPKKMNSIDSYQDNANLYNYNFFDHDEETEKIAQKVNSDHKKKVHMNSIDSYQDNANLYNYNFFDHDEETEKVAQKINSDRKKKIHMNSIDSYQDNANLYNYNFFDHDEETEKVAQKVNGYNKDTSKVKINFSNSCGLQLKVPTDI